MFVRECGLKIGMAYTRRQEDLSFSMAQSAHVAQNKCMSYKYRSPIYLCVVCSYWHDTGATDMLLMVLLLVYGTCIANVFLLRLLISRSSGICYNVISVCHSGIHHILVLIGTPFIEGLIP